MPAPKIPTANPRRCDAKTGTLTVSDTQADAYTNMTGRRGLGGTGALFAAFGRWNWLDWHGRDQQELRFHEPQTVN
ncbi:unnamed protein product [[Actinomadura] parvosata subsp. kistnae]|nr:unnamed protein product [Actinomadura parvosata subsp. kistnae]